MKNKYILILFILLSSGITSQVSAQKLKPLISGFNYDYELPAGINLPEGYRDYRSFIQSDINIVSEERILFLQDSVSRTNFTQKDRQTALQQALLLNNGQLAAQIAKERLRIGSAEFFKNNREIDFAVELNVSRLQYEIVEQPESDTIMKLNYQAVVKVVDAQTNEVFYSQSVSESPEELVITKPAMVLYFTPEELLQLKFKKKDMELKKQIYHSAIDRLNRKVFQNAVDSAASVLDDQLLPLRKLSFPLYSAKGKYDYEKLEKAEEIMKEISQARKVREKTVMSREEEISKLREAIAIWEEELTTEDGENKKARINAVIAEGLRYNCAMAYMLMRDFDKANEYVHQLNMKQPTIISKPEHYLPMMALELKQLIAESEVRLGDKL
ncbi:hypothetical protein GCM10011506_44410 [Marivirga lumbricoides]|uniref:Uncharacterized protein n=1 Tax=Marivirga lumbricoides TaxID=1046115 RepID=A0ABQ1N802_9BACT|nr:hypothetical protein GCM10011506_44410 [Marivirga lumbricoides]